VTARTLGRGLAVLAGAAAAVLLWAALAPVRSASRDALFEIPKGTWARRMAGAQTEILPDTIRLTLGVQDVLLLRNLDDVPQIFGPTLLMPGQSFRLPFQVASSYPFACTAHVSGQMTVVVDPEPTNPWLRVRYRAYRAAGLWDRAVRPLPAGGSGGGGEGA
jgi:hypothetical protein